MVGPGYSLSARSSGSDSGHNGIELWYGALGRFLLAWGFLARKSLLPRISPAAARQCRKVLIYKALKYFSIPVLRKPTEKANRQNWLDKRELIAYINIRSLDR
jgi:hypothetical protein